MDNPRKTALACLIKSDVSSSFSNIDINTVLQRLEMSKKDVSLFTALYMGVIEHKITLDYIISQYSDIPDEKIDAETKNVLRMGLCQLIYMDKIPEYSAIDECVKLSLKKSKGYVNAVLRNFVRNSKKFCLPKEKWERVCIENSIPADILNIWRKSYKDETALRLSSYRPLKNELSIKVNSLICTPDEIYEVLTKKGYKPRISRFSEDIIKCSVPISDIKNLLDAGKIFIQDESSRMAVRILGAKSGDKVADVCASPGGKAFSCAIDMKNKGEIFASDLHENKISLIESGAKKLGIDIIRTRAKDARDYNREYEKSFDCVICDVPCSGLGVIYKKPDIKYKSRLNIEALPSVQYEILSNCSGYVKAGGVLLYSTCTLNKEENENNIIKFLGEHTDFAPVDFEFREIKSQEGMYTFFPHITDTDGFFAAKIKRVR